MRIAMISTPFVSVPPRDYGGTELIVHELVEELARRGHDVTLFATGDSRTSAGLRALYGERQWPPETLTDLNHVSWAVREAIAGGFDVVHAHSAVALALTRFVPDLPLVYTIHHERDEKYSELYGHFSNVHYVAISANQARREARLPRMDVIHHGLDPSRFEWRPDAAEYVCFVGRFARVKGPHTAIDVAARAGLRIRIAGESHAVDGDFGEREVVPRLVLPHVEHLGCIGPAVKVPLLRDARALLFPIEWEEPFGLIMIEAMLSGCPVVAFARGSVPEVVEPEVTGYVVADADEMARVVRPGGPIDRFDRGRCRAVAVERFGRDRMVAEHERVYARVAAGRRAVGGARWT